MCDTGVCAGYYGVALDGRRDQVFLASKTHDRTRDGSLRLLDDSLRRLRTDRLDLWQLHDLRTQADLDRIFGQAGALEALLAAREQGRVRFLGITGHHDPAILLEATRRFEFDTVLVAVNAADVHRLSFIQTVLPAADRRGMGVIAMKVYAAGQLVQRRRFAGVFRSAGLTAEQALGYVLSLDGVSTAIIGCQTPDEATENAQIARSFVRANEQAMRRLEQATAANAAAWTTYKRP